jgi:hypothetical protein
MFAVAAAAALLAPACSPDESTSETVDAAPVVPDARAQPDARSFEPTGDHYQYVIDTIQLPADSDEAEALGLDVDGDAVTDNGLGQLIQVLNGALSTDVGALLTEQVDDGRVIVLANLQTVSFGDAERVGFWILRGADPVPQPCLDAGDTICRRHLTGTGSFTVAPGATTDSLIGGNIAGGFFNGYDFGTITIYVPVMAGAPPLAVAIVGARAYVDVGESGLMSGKLAGGLTDEEIQTNLLPQLLVLWNDRIAEQCSGTSPDCCPDGSDGDQLVDLFDSDGSCDLTLQELQDSIFLNALLEPDVDLLDAEGFYNPREDGVLDSISIGIGFTAVPATYDLPPDIAQ